MERRRARLGDVVDDYCTRCRLIMNHGIVGMVGDEVRKVRCNTCMTEHVYKHGKLPAKKRRENSKLFDEVLRGLGRTPDPIGDEDEAPAPEVGAAEETPAAVSESDAGDDAAVASPDGEPTGEGSVPTAPPPASDERPADDEHGVRRRLYTIRRHSGGKPPAGAAGADTTGGGGIGVGRTFAGNLANDTHVVGHQGGRRGGGQGGGQGGGHHGGRQGGSHGGQGGHGGKGSQGGHGRQGGGGGRGGRSRGRRRSG